LPLKDFASTGSMRSSGMSVMKPRRPWLMPISGTSYGASWRAMPSMVPSPPMTMAASQWAPISVALITRTLTGLSSRWAAVCSSNTTA
jgi:hypothetical protein